MENNPYGAIRWVWKNGELVPFEKATLHVLSHVVHYGSGWFEGIRCYETPHGPAVFRLRDHLERLEASCKIFRVEPPYSLEEIAAASLETIRANELGACYIRPIVYRGLGPLGVNPLGCPIDTVIAVWPWGQYLGDDALDKGVDVCVSTWRRFEASTYPALAKSVGGYLNAQLIKMEAVLGGFAEGIALDTSGCLSEGSAENLFLVSKGVLWTPPLSASILQGVTRSTVLAIAAELGIPVREEQLPRSMLYVCEELFMCGTAVEITPVRSVDRLPVGDGKPGPITRRIQQRFMSLVTGRSEDRHGWLTHVSMADRPVAAASV